MVIRSFILNYFTKSVWKCTAISAFFVIRLSVYPAVLQIIMHSIFYTLCTSNNSSTQPMLDNFNKTSMRNEFLTDVLIVQQQQLLHALGSAVICLYCKNYFCHAASRHPDIRYSSLSICLFTEWKLLNCSLS